MSTRRAVAWTWKQELGRRAESFEVWVDAAALRVADRILGKEGAETVFGPHPAAR